MLYKYARLNPGDIRAVDVEVREATAVTTYETGLASHSGTTHATRLSVGVLQTC